MYKQHSAVYGRFEKLDIHKEMPKKIHLFSSFFLINSSSYFLFRLKLMAAAILHIYVKIIIPKQTFCKD